MPVFAELLDDRDDRVRMEAPEIFRVLGKRRPEFVTSYLETLRRISETDPIASSGFIVPAQSRRRRLPAEGLHAASIVPCLTVRTPPFVLLPFCRFLEKNRFLHNNAPGGGVI